MYSITNENLHAIISGLDLQENDNVFGILSSGDFLLAALEFCNKIRGVDMMKEQIQFFLKKFNLLKKRKFEKFLEFIKVREGDKGFGIEEKGYDPEKQKDYLKEYFSVNGRLERISSKLSRLTFQKCFLCNEKSSNLTFNKIYISNAGSYGDLQFYAKILPKKGLLYSAGDLSNFIEYLNLLKIEKELTKKARELEGAWWKPTVFIKE